MIVMMMMMMMVMMITMIIRPSEAVNKVDTVGDRNTEGKSIISSSTNTQGEIKCGAYKYKYKGKYK